MIKIYLFCQVLWRKCDVILHGLRLCLFMQLSYFKVKLTNVHTELKDNSQFDQCFQRKLALWIIKTHAVYLKEQLMIPTWDISYQCIECDKVFSNNGILTSHLMIHIREKPYQCSHCGKAFADKCTLLKHNKTHTGEKPYQCIQCDKAFTFNDNLKNI